MRAYTVTVAGDVKPEGLTFLQYAGTQGDAMAIKNKVFEDHRESGLRRKDIDIQEIEIPTAKKDLISWINDHTTSQA